nr:hypothetical protein GCM10025732_16140 [Glycomyces mayteni]
MSAVSTNRRRSSTSSDAAQSTVLTVSACPMREALADIARAACTVGTHTTMVLMVFSLSMLPRTAGGDGATGGNRCALM